MKKLTNKGFTMVESLLSLFIVSLGMSLFISIIPYIKKLNEMDVDIDVEIGLMQLRDIMLTSSEVLFDIYELRFYYQGKDISLEIIDDRVVRKDGFVIYLEGLEYPYFSQKESCYYLNYEKDFEIETRFLGCE